MRDAPGPRLLWALALLLSFSNGTAAQPAAPAPSLGQLLVPGGVARLFQAASLPPPPDRAYALLTLSHLLYLEAPGGSSERDAAAARLRDYLDVLGQWSIRAAPFAGGVSLSAARAKTGRRQLEDLLAFVGLAVEESGGAWHAVPRGDPDVPRRRTLLTAAGLDPGVIEEALNAGATVDVAIPGDTVPLPLSAGTWLDAVFDNRVAPEALFALVIGEREALWLYHGLLGLDADTRRFMESQPALLAWIHRNRPALFGAFGRGFRVREGRVETPGGAGDAGLWESLARAPTSDPARFLRALLERDAGRLAWFYDTIAHLSPDRRAALAAAPEKEDAAARLDAFRSLYAVFLSFNPEWNVATRPFVRRSFDPTLALHLLDIRPGGRLAGPPWASFWEEALGKESLPDRAPEAFEHLEEGGPASVPHVLGRVFAAPLPEHAALLQIVLFAGRVFDAAGRAQAFDELVALRGYAMFPALMPVLEHLGVREPGVYAEAARAAAAVWACQDARGVAADLAQLQGALALLERLGEVGAIDAVAATGLARELFTARPAPDGWYHGAILDWLGRRLLPALGAVEGDETADARVTMALAGFPRVPGPPARVVEWHGQRYRADLSRMALARLLAVLEKSAAPELGAILVAREAADGQAAEGLGSRQTSALLGRPLAGTEALPKRLDRWLAEWLASLAYAVRIENLDAPILLAGNPALRHDLRVLDYPRSARLSWSIPSEESDSGEGRHLRGALLGLALPLSPYALARTELPAAPRPPTLHQSDEALLRSSVTAFSPLDVTDEERDAIARAISRGRARMAALLGEPGAWSSIADELSADDWERQLVPWMLVHEPDRVSRRFSAHDLFVLGGGERTGWADHWGMLARPLDGSLFPRSPTSLLQRVLANQGGAGVLFTQFCDIQFRVAEFLAESRLPASLGRALLALVVSELIEQATLCHVNDWPALVRAAREISNERLESYVSKLAADGLLVRQESAPAQKVPERENGALLRRCP